MLKKIVGAPEPDVSGHYPPDTIFFSLNLDGETFRLFVTTSDGIDPPAELTSSPLSISKFVEGLLTAANGGEFADGISAVKTSDVVNNLTTYEAGKPLSANQGAVLSDLLSAITQDAVPGGSTLRELYDYTALVETDLGSFIASDDPALETFQAVVTYIKSTQTQVTSQAASKVNVGDIVDSLVSTDASKPLSAAQGKVLSDALAAAQANLLGGVGTQGDTLKKLYDLISAIQALLTSDDVSLDTVQEIVTYIKANQSALTTLGQNKVNISDIINVLTSTETAKPLSAAQGKVLNDALTALSSTVSGKENAIAASAVDNYYAGDKSWRTFAPDVRNTVLTGLSLLSGAAVAAGDSVISAIGKLQVQVSDRLSRAAGGTIAGAVKFAGQQTTGVVDMASGTAIDCSQGNYYTKTVSANTTFSFSNVPSGAAYGLTLVVNHTGGTLSFPASVKFLNDAAPSLTTGKRHLFTFVTDDGGTTWRASVNTPYSA